jgi:subtilisin
VINASFGTFDDSINAGANGAAVRSLEDVVRLVIDRNIVVVASATNVAFADEPKDYLPSPASYNLRIGDGLIVVGGSTTRDGLLLRPVESRRGAGIDLAAPGHRIRAIGHQYGDARSHGTSFSTALVTGAVSLLRSRFPSLGARAVERVIKGAAVVRPAVPGGRRLHIDRALRDAGRL